MKEAKRGIERGQILIIIAMAFIGLIGITALAIDGGMLYFDHRRAQTAADNAAMAGALKILQGATNSAAVSAAVARASSNGFNNDGVTNWVDVHTPPTSGQYNGMWGYVQVHIRARSDTSLIQVVYSGLSENQVDAVSHATQAGGNFEGDSIVGLNPHACKTVWFSGNGNVSIDGGNVFSNSLASPPPASCGAGVKGGSGDINLTGGGHFNIVGQYVKNGGSGAVNPAPVTGEDQKQLRPVPLPDCGSSTPVSVSVHGSQNKTISPGRYSQIKQTGGTLKLNPGLYCLYGDFSSSGNILENSSPTDAGVLIYMVFGSLKLTGGQVTLRALEPGTGTPPIYDAFPQGEPKQPFDFSHYLVYASPSNTDDMTIEGNNGTTYAGTILAPSSHCFLGGTGSAGTVIGYNSQIICDTVEVTGTSDVNFVYNVDNNGKLPAVLDLVK